MTEKDAIEVLKNIQDNLEKTLSLDICAIDTAIEALKEQQHGEWKLVQRGKYVDIVCPLCGYVREDSIAYGYTTDQVMYSIKQGVFGYDFPNFCEECGAKMGLKEGEKND